MVPERLYVIGPGTTTARVLSALDLEGTLTGVDVVRNCELVVADASESDLLLLLADRPPTTIILGVIGGQGFLLGRGNQQISPRVLASVDEEDVVIVASAEKILTLDPPVLRIDFGDTRALSTLMGYRRVRTGPTAATILKVVS
jgi:predicted polyphosphate/ATP-dependent NAD kinase